MKTAGIVVLLSLALFCLFSDVSTQGGEKINCSEFRNDSFCSRESNPVCGSDGLTYGNKCAFCKAAEKSNGRLTVRHMGGCR